MVRTVSPVLCNVLKLMVVVCLVSGLAGCGFSVDRARDGLAELITPTDVSIIRHHVRQFHACLYEFTDRLYAKNPKYEKDPVLRYRKLNAVFNKGPVAEYEYAYKFSHQVLTAAFQKDVSETDRVYLLGLGLWKSIKEAYNVRDEGVFLSGLQISLEQLQRLHHNISQVNWRLKTCRDNKGDLLFLTNEAGADGYINMGYEVIMTRILTRIEDDIVMRGGLPEKYVFRMSTLFASIVI